MTDSTTRDFPPLPIPPKEEEIAVASLAWVPVEEDEEDLDTAPLGHFSDSDEKEEEEEGESVASPAWVPVEEDKEHVSDSDEKKEEDSSAGSLNNNSSDDDDDLFSDDEESVSYRGRCCHDDEQEPTSSCCNLKGIGNTLARGFCRVVNMLVSCVTEKLTSRQMFILVGAAIAAIFKTKNVAMDGEKDPSADYEDGDDINSANNNSVDIIGTIVDTAVDSISSTNAN